jgi:hypothetical protein
MIFQITESYDLWQKVKKCRWEKGKKKIKEVQKNEKKKHNIIQSKIVTIDERKENFFLKSNYKYK